MIKIEDISPSKRIAIFVVLMFGVVYGAYWYLFHPIPVKVAASGSDEVIIVVRDQSVPTQQYETTTNYALIKDYLSNAASSLKGKDTKQNPANYLIIDKIGVSAPLESVGFDKDGNMATPSGPNVVAWYSQGAKIGSVGNAVISGHKDTTKGKAVFYRLGELTVGDKVLVTDSTGKGYQYTVDSKNSYPKDNFPAKEIFSNGTSARLNLVTCSGTYDKNARSYSHRLVVSAVLAK
jgi:sortase A